MELKSEEARKLHAELMEIAGQYPGPLHGVEERLRKIEFAFNYSSNLSPYVREKAFKAIHWVRIWRSEREWRRWGDDPSRLQSIMHNDLFVLGSLIERELPDSTESVPSR